MTPHLYLRNYYFWYFATVAAVIPFLPLYLKEQGISEGDIGTLVAIGPIIMLTCQPLWGILSDYLQAPTRVLSIALLGCAITVTLFPLQLEFWWLFLIMASYMFFQAPAIPLADSIALTHIEENGDSFGQIRLWGSLGFSIMVLVLGYLFLNFGLNKLFVTAAVLYLVSLLSSVVLPKGKKEPRVQILSSAGKLLAQRPFAFFLVYGLIIQASFNSYNAFFGIYFTSIGGSTEMLGIAWTISALSEIPFFLYADKLIRRFSTKTLLTIAGLVFTLRWLLFAYLTDPYIVMAFQPLQGLSFGLFYLAAIQFVNQQSPKGLKTTGQSLFAALTFGLGSALGSFISGNFIEAYSLSGMFLFWAALCIVARFRMENN